MSVRREMAITNLLFMNWATRRQNTDESRSLPSSFTPHTCAALQKCSPDSATDTVLPFFEEKKKHVSATWEATMSSLRPNSADSVGITPFTRRMFAGR